MQVKNNPAHLLCNWTGYGINKCHHSIDLGGLTLDVWPGVPGFPEDVFANTIDMREGIFGATSPAKIRRFEDNNWTALHEVDRVPVKAIVNQFHYPELHARSNRGGLQNFYPVGLTEEDIGSNLGVLGFLRDEYNKHVMAPAPVYRIIVADCNIYLRIVKV